MVKGVLFGVAKPYSVGRILTYSVSGVVFPVLNLIQQRLLIRNATLSLNKT